MCSWIYRQCAFLFLLVVCMYGQQEQMLNQTRLAKDNDDRKETLPIPSAVNQPTFQERHPRYLLQKNDVFDIDFTLTPEFNQTVTVQPDGYVSLRGAGSVHVEGQSVSQVTDTIRISYSKILHNPVIAIILKDFEKPYFVAAGELTRPGKYDLRGDTTLLQAVSIAGGFSVDAKRSEVYVFRRASNEWVQIKRLDVKRMLHDKTLAEDVHLSPGDMVYVSKTPLSKFKGFIPNLSSGVSLRY